MTKQKEIDQDDQKPVRRSPPEADEGGKTFTGKDVIEAAKEMLKTDSIGSKLTPDALEKLSRLLAKTALKGDM